MIDRESLPPAQSPDHFERRIGVDVACQLVLGAVSPLPAVPMPVGEALGLVLATPIVAGMTLPPFANSAMDGYAVRAVDTTGATPEVPVRLRTAGLAAAGEQPHAAVGIGSAIRIMTGAPLPDGADAVVPFEDTDQRSAPKRVDSIGISHAAHPGQNVRLAGEDVRAGQTVLSAGHLLQPAEIGLLAALGVESVQVRRRPRVAIMSTGNELVPAGVALRPGQIHDANGPLLSALASECGAEVQLMGVVRDHPSDLAAAIRSAGETDLIISSGGISVGDFDLVHRALGAMGQIERWQVRMKPGKPLAFGRIGSIAYLGLAGNPIAAAVGFEIFARPLILKMLGRRGPYYIQLGVTLADPISNRGGHRQYVRARIEREASGRLVGWPAGGQGSAILSTLTRANGLLIIPEELEVAPAGRDVEAILLDRDPRAVASLVYGFERA